MSGEVTIFFIMANEVKQNQAPGSIVTPPELWFQHKKLGIKIKQFTDAPMHMLFLGVTTIYWCMLSVYLATKIQIIDFVESYLSISKMAKISLLIGVPPLILQKLNQYQPLVGNLLSKLLFHTFP
jgi:hypothetical protein